MTIDIRIHIGLSARQKRLVRAAVVVGSVIGAVGIGDHRLGVAGKATGAATEGTLGA